MATTALTDRPVDDSAGGRRQEVLGVLRRTGRPLSAAEVAEAVGVHLNTARSHLEALADKGWADRTSEAREVPGRPRILYSATAPSPGPRSYRLLAEMLTGLVTTANAAGAAVETGRAWGRHLVERPAPSERIDADEAVTRLHRVLDAVGFAPEVTPTATGSDVRLHHCPFREVAEQHTDVVCRLHLGLVQGALGALGAPVEATAIEPFVTPQLCIARLRTTDA